MLHERRCQKQATDACYWGELKPVLFQLKFSATQTCLCAVEIPGKLLQISLSWGWILEIHGGGKTPTADDGHQSSAPGVALVTCSPSPGPCCCEHPLRVATSAPAEARAPGRLGCSLPACVVARCPPPGFP